MKKERNIAEIVVGVFVIVLCAVLLVYTYRSTQLGHHKQYMLRAEFDSAEGLRKGSPVRVSGVTVGSVTDVSLDPKRYAAVVTFAINDDIRLPEDSEAVVASDGLVGGTKSVGITPGGASKILRKGDVIVRTRGPSNLETLLQKYIFDGGKGGADKPSSQDGAVTPQK